MTKLRADKAALNAEKGLEMRRISMETMGDSSKRRQASDDDREKRKEKRFRRVQNDTFQYLSDKLKHDIKWQRKDFELKERMLEEKVKNRENKEKEREWYREHLERRQNEMLLQISRHLQEQQTLILTLVENSKVAK